MPDRWETDHGFDPDSSTDAELDQDEDGQSNRSEFFAGTDPLVRASALALEMVSVDSSANTAGLRWSSVAGKRYQVAVLSPEGNWIPVEGGSIVGAPDSTELPIETGGLPGAIFRVETGLSY